MAAPRVTVHFRSFRNLSTHHARLYSAFSTLTNRGALIPPARWSSSAPAEPSIPEWQKPKNEPVERTKSRLLYQSRKRGISENGLLLGNFASQYLHQFNDDQLDQYDTLINKPNNDWDLFNWATGNKPVPPEYDNGIMKLLKEFVSNPKMESRLRQPDLPEK